MSSLKMKKNIPWLLFKTFSSIWESHNSKVSKVASHFFFSAFLLPNLLKFWPLKQLKYEIKLQEHFFHTRFLAMGKWFSILSCIEIIFICVIQKWNVLHLLHLCFIWQKRLRNEIELTKLSKTNFKQWII